MALAQLRPTEARDAWEWRGSRFTVRAAYRLLLAMEPPEDPVYVRRCRLLWRRRIPLKFKIFCWLLIRGRLMTRSLRQGFVLEADANCVMCSDTTEDCSHLFFECPLVQPVWIAAALGGIDVTAGDAFWHSVCQGTFRREAEWQIIFTTLWAIWLYQNEIIFRGRLPFTDAVRHSASGIARSWHLGGTIHSGVAPLL